MARRMVGDDQDVFRVVLVSKAREWSDEARRWVETGVTETEHFGPYNTIGAARGQRTSLGYVDYYDYESDEWIRTMRKGVVSCRIQKAHTTWEDVA
ncbi:hypothetical protein I1A49_16460 [Streptomyces malaysiensis subsp. malaysiensis]|uniref:Uncharacterized protein n=1 Tax=Streptomyces malaysiensis TaxID=92644 RepID=A0ABX6W4I1_STRMQ|nr:MULTISPECIES: hypothetical protein [Streptomyces]QPI56319.1 hypothetical protein I1A49_16460 [Streptomyces solisilvae]UHH17804.1 hypothetical protein LUV23_16575 [Streptomyces sp. HNM0561]